ncbi:c-type cytochrome [Accumulibacter sp.]|uniref:c-type cytochrome n=1 Tax=Accumulibacter sp. TaxID=2053492 RepID=UPI0026130881|nr:c-type cytochrome [Accumulibacter sp.]
MYQAPRIALVLSLAAAGTVIGEPMGIESRSYQWYAPDTERFQALKLPGNAKAGQADYEALCATCHLASGAGLPDGSVPRLAGQHSTVLVKQLADIRSGLRDNPTMYPYAKRLASAQALADVAAYIETLCVPRDTGRYEGPEAASLVAYGKMLYDKDCVQCHRANGDGAKERLYPLIAGQHYAYLLRQMRQIRDGTRRNSHPDMVRVIARYDNAQLIAIAAYQAALTSSLRQWSVKPRFCQPSS